MKQNNEVFVVGHKNPDTDSICSSIVYAKLRQKAGDNFVPARAGKINKETEFVLNRFKTEPPFLLDNASGKKLVLVDHNEKDQMVDGSQEAEILEIIDHHKFNFSYHSPIYIYAEPIGSTATVIAKLYFEEIEKDSQLAGLLLAAILSDTVILKSLTTTQEDREIVKELSEIAGIDNWEEFGFDLKKINASIEGLAVEEFVNRDLKDFNFAGRRVAIGQIEVIDFKEAQKRKKEILNYLQVIKQKGNYELVLLMMTDIVKEGTELLFAGSKEIIEKSFNKKPIDESIYLKGVMSRKKQVVPSLERAFLS